MKVEILTIGDELLLGFTVDTNSVFLARELAELGVEVVRRTTLPDTGSAIIDGVREALARTGAVITTGGLGPTSDDLTCEAVAAAFGVPLVRDNDVHAALESRWKNRGLPGEAPADFFRQALVPEGADILANPAGSAPGLWLENSRHEWLAVLPGVPREMRAIFHDSLRARIAVRAGPGAGVVRSRTLRTTGVPESLLAERLTDAADRLGPLSLSYLPGSSGVDLRVTARNLPSDEADRLLHDAMEWLRDRAGSDAYGENEADMAEAVLDLCRQRNFTLALAESCTGGMLGARLSAIPGASEVLLGGVIAYADQVKERQLGVSSESLISHGAVSREVAEEMASGARVRLSASIGVGITGVAGPGGGTESKPVGTVWIAADVLGQVLAELYRFQGSREEVRERSAHAALALIRRMLTR
ncbi:MAG TPA: competence/damage-inducible protein A [Gemmatimonadales bacterium]|nr:competence/damage-inducible protein A [Gemmatimonadales bacterium]